MSNDDFPRSDGPDENPHVESDRANEPVETGDMTRSGMVMSDRSAIDLDPVGSSFPDSEGRQATSTWTPPRPVAAARGSGQAKEVEGLSQGQIVWSRFVRHKGAMFGVAILALIALLSYTAMGIGPIPGWWKYQSHTATSDIVNGAAPTLSWSGLGEHPFGQDNIGRDNFAMVLSGVQTSLLVMTVLG